VLNRLAEFTEPQEGWLLVTDAVTVLETGNGPMDTVPVEVRFTVEGAPPFTV
jgi:hypothetical protein